MRLKKDYLGAVSERVLSSRSVDVNPSLMCEACVDVLPVDGAGISLVQKSLRVPLGWSSPAVGVAERAQTTVGTGPCLSAAEAGSALAAGERVIADRWPVYWGELQRLTSFRSVASIPLSVGDDAPFGALDLYADEAGLTPTLALPDLTASVAEPIAVMLSGAFARLYDEEVGVPDWLTEDPAVGRVAVWTAVGMVVGSSEQDDLDALATLRGWAYSHGLSLDEVADRLVERDLPVEAVLGDS
ncbi:GAF domain-containing protein [Microlunatus spumicola]|uniref:GAF domain-containing protein n=1 Tax=Microlunatus spumicola TaxID=81499 RepID=A0ABP6Y5C7_9ACTN